MQIVAANNLASLYSGFDLFTLPFLIKSEQCGVEKVNSSDSLREAISKESEKKANIRVLSWSYAGMRNMMNSKHPILKPADLKGLRMRVAKNPILLDTYKTLGGSPIGIASKETYSALQTKVVDGNDGGVAWAYANKFFEVQKYYTITGHQMVFMPLIINNKFFMGMPEDVQKGLQKAALESANNNRQYMLKKGTEMVEDMGRKGLEISRIDLTPFRDAVKPVWEKYSERVGGMQMIEKVLALQADCN
jgi:tripartite ATP-independent transporter DctP family solute receptor